MKSLIEFLKDFFLNDPDGPPRSEEEIRADRRALKRTLLWTFAIGMGVVVVGMIGLMTLAGRAQGRLYGPEGAHRLIVPLPPVTFDGDGTLHAFMDEPPFGPHVEKHAPKKSAILGADRDVLVYLPPGYDKSAAPYPLLVVFHGYLDRPLHTLTPVVNQLDDKIRAGTMPPCVAIVPDLSLGGRGRDLPTTPLDDRLGSWGLNSNRGRYNDWIFDELVPWMRAEYNATDDAARTILTGFSAGGYLAVLTMLRDSSLADTVIAISPALDLRYSVNGDRLAAYDPKGYQPITTDDPNRPVVKLGPYGTYTDAWAFWPVFNSDETPGPVWKNDLPVWQRLKDNNPADLLRDEAPDLSGHAVYLVVGAQDEFKFFNQVQVVRPLLAKAGAELFPDDPIRPGHHEGTFVTEQMSLAFDWLGPRLSSQD
ncbi:MAG: hypothetical protein H6684_15170 [Deltaproteobacteria bacterium]|nr:hypothetical protein [Deltaproteobacteria bacterium]MCB9490072.1 hypothetical protein [Deltaproteobacteria bacterium]